MARQKRPDPLERQLAQLRALDATAPEAIDVLRDVLRVASGIAVAPAARLVAEHQLVPLFDELAPAFERLLDDPIKRDPGCRGKCAIVKALHALDRWEERVFAAGLRHRQIEGIDREDTGAQLRGLCGIAHAQLGHDDALEVLAALLADPERIARIAAAQGLADAGRPDAAALLRYKLLVGDAEPEVIAACVESLLALARERSYEFLIRFLDAHDERAEMVALGLGGARIAGAFEPLSAWCVGATREQRRRVGYLAIALVRSEPATEYLLEAIRTQAPADATAAAQALATFRDDLALAARIRNAAGERGDAGFDREVEAFLSR